MLVDIPDDMIEAQIAAGGDESYRLHIADEVLRQAELEHPEWFNELDEEKS